MIQNNNKISQNACLITQKKRTLFHCQIRKQQKNKIFQKIRQQLMIPQQLYSLLQYNISTKIDQIFEYIHDEEYKQWHFLISQKIKENNQQLEDILYGNIWSDNNYKKIYLFAFLLKNDGNIAQFYKSNINKLISQTQNWTQQQQMTFLIVFTIMLKQRHQFVIKDAVQYLKDYKYSRFYMDQLKFYRTLLEHYGTQQYYQHYGDAIFSINTIRKLGHNVQSSFYELQQTKKMMQILIMLLYISNKQKISSYFNLQSLFTSLQYYISHATQDKKLTQRALILIYNINIDQSSQIFIMHDCFNVVTAQMKKQENHKELRSIMVELYINTIINYPRPRLEKYLNKYYKKYCQNIEYIVDNFHQKQDLADTISQFIEYIDMFIENSEDKQLQKKYTHCISSSLINTLSKYRPFQKVYDIMNKKVTFL